MARTVSSAVAGLLLIAASSMTWAAERDLGHETLAPNDGWASFSGGTSGGTAADRTHIVTVQDRRGLVAALQAGDKPKIIYVDGDIDANTDDNGDSIGCDKYAATGYALDAYVQAFDPAVWGTSTPPAGPLEDARRLSQQNQAARVQLQVGSNTTIVGLHDTAFVTGAELALNGVDNVIVRNLNFEDAFDCFPAWDPTDGGSWSPRYSSVSVRGSTHIWIDHDSFDTGLHVDAGQPVFMGRQFLVHASALDVSHGSDLVTVSWNEFHDYDRAVEIGSSSGADPGNVRVTLHHNLSQGVSSEAPHVASGQVHLYNNLYDIPSTSRYLFSWGIEANARLYAESNFFLSSDVRPNQLLRASNATALHATGTLLGPALNATPVDVLAVYNAEHDGQLAPDVGWTPTLTLGVEPTPSIVGGVRDDAGPLSVP
jgi:pectate lyase